MYKKSGRKRERREKRKKKEEMDFSDIDKIFKSVSKTRESPVNPSPSSRSVPRSKVMTKPQSLPSSKTTERKHTSIFRKIVPTKSIVPPETRDIVRGDFSMYSNLPRYTGKDWRSEFSSFLKELFKTAFSEKYYDFEVVETIINKNFDLWERAATDKSASSDDNEKLEFVGDKLLNYYMGKITYEFVERFHNDVLNPGTLSNVQNRFLSDKLWKEYAKEIKLDSYLIIDPENEKTEKAIGSFFESFMASILLAVDSAKNFYINQIKEMDDKDLAMSILDFPSGTEVCMRILKYIFYGLIEKYNPIKFLEINNISKIDQLPTGHFSDGKPMKIRAKERIEKDGKLEFSYEINDDIIDYLITNKDIEGEDIPSKIEQSNIRKELRKINGKWFSTKDQAAEYTYNILSEQGFSKEWGDNLKAFNDIKTLPEYLKLALEEKIKNEGYKNVYFDSDIGFGRKEMLEKKDSLRFNLYGYTLDGKIRLLVNYRGDGKVDKKRQARIETIKKYLESE